MRTVPSSKLTLATLMLLAATNGYALASDEKIDQVTHHLPQSVVVKGAAEKTSTLEEVMARYKVPGVSVAVIDNGKIAWAQGFGLKVAGGKDAVSADTMFQAASISKPVTATAMLRLVEQGKFALDAPINTYLKSWQLPDNEYTKTEKVTLRRLASHSAGLNLHGFPGYASGAKIPTIPQILEGQAPANTKPVRVEMTPGSVWKYSGAGTTIMQLAMTDTTGKSFPRLMQELVLAPLGMKHSAFEQPLSKNKQKLIAAAHDEEGRLVKGSWHTYPELAAAGLWTTPTDLSKWAIEIGEARAGKSTKVLSQATATEMLTEQKAPSGLGPMVHNSGDAMYFEHGGSNEGYRCFVVYFPALRRGAAIMTNGEGGSFVYRPLLGAIAKVYDWPDFKPREIEAVALNKEFAEQAVGEYPFPANTPTDKPPSVLVSVENGQLMIEVPKFIPKMEAVMQANGKALTLENGFEWSFVKAEDGSVVAVEFNGRKLGKKSK